MAEATPRPDLHVRDRGPHRACGRDLDETGAIVYDALFLALAEDAQTVVVTADGKLLRTLEGTPYASLARSLRGVSNHFSQ